jgi:hypothetical protein
VVCGVQSPTAAFVVLAGALGLPWPVVVTFETFVLDWPT